VEEYSGGVQWRSTVHEYMSTTERATSSPCDLWCGVCVVCGGGELCGCGGGVGGGVGGEWW
jgi:hypothetical protein